MNQNNLQGRQRGWVKLILFPFTSMTKGQPISFHASQSGGGECVKRTLSSAFVVDVDCGSHYHTGEKQKFQAKLRSRKAYWVRRHNWSRINFGVEFCLATLYGLWRFKLRETNLKKSHGLFMLEKAQNSLISPLMEKFKIFKTVNF